MKVISLWQPWASFIAWGQKSIETRSWGTSYRGPIAIHAALKWSDEQMDFCASNSHAVRVLKEKGYAAWKGERLLERLDWEKLGTLPRGGIVAVANLVECFQVLGSGTVPPQRNPDGNGGYHYPGATRLLYRSPDLPEVKCLDITAQESAFGDHSVGRWCWLLDDIRPVEPMIPLRGFQRIWNAPDDLVAELTARGLLVPATSTTASEGSEA